MRADQLTIEVRAPSLSRVGQLTGADLADVLITPRANNVGSWSIALPEAVRNPNGTESPHELCALLRQPGYGIIVTGPNGVILSGPTTGANHVMSPNDPGGTWTITGVSDLICIARSEAWPDPGNSNPSTAAHANDVRTGPVETLMHQFVNVNIGPGGTALRKNAALTMGTNLGRGPSRKESPRYKNLLALLQELGTGNTVQFDVLQVGSTLQFTTWLAADLTQSVRLDIENNQLTSEQAEYSAPNVTEVKVMGQGEGTERQIITRTSTESLAAAALWGVRIERTIDQRQTDDVAELEQAGDELLAEEGLTIFSFRVVPSGDIAETFEDGDFITIVVNDRETTAQVTERPIAINSEGVFVGATIGDPTGFDWESLVDVRQDRVERRVSALERNLEIPPAAPDLTSRVVALEAQTTILMAERPVKYDLAGLSEFNITGGIGPNTEIQFYFEVVLSVSAPIRMRVRSGSTTFTTAIYDSNQVYAGSAAPSGLPYLDTAYWQLSGADAARTHHHGQVNVYALNGLDRTRYVAQTYSMNTNDANAMAIIGGRLDNLLAYDALNVWWPSSTVSSGFITVRKVG